MSGQPKGKPNFVLDLMLSPRKLPHGGLMAGPELGSAETLAVARQMVGALPTGSEEIRRHRVETLAARLDRLRSADKKTVSDPAPVAAGDGQG